MKPSEGPYKVVKRDDAEFCGYEVEGPMGDIWDMTEAEAIDRARIFNHVHNVAYRLGQEKMREMAVKRLERSAKSVVDKDAKELAQFLAHILRALPIDGEGEGE